MIAPMSAPRIYVPVDGGPSPTDLPDVGAITPRQPDPPVRPTQPSPRPMSSLVAAAARLTSVTVGRGRGRRASAEGWQEDAWEMYDLVGELRFVTNLLANQASKARFYVGTLAENPDDPPVPTENPVLAQALEAIGDGPSGLTQLIKRLGVNLQIPGDGWLCGIPRDLLPDADDNVVVVRAADGSVRLDDLVWYTLSVTEVAFPSKDEVEVTMGDDAKADKITASADDLWLIRVWNPHPRRFWQADSATRSALPVLRELVGLTMHISAQIDSRLAGAGVIIAPDSAARAAKRAMNLPEDGPDDPFTDALIKAMMTPISDRANASAYVPLVWTVPDEAEPHFRFMDFAKPLDAQAKDMRDEAIRRYALSADAPPELLLGVGSMNHWGAWLVQEDTVRAHIEPPLALMCDAFTTQYLRVLMREMGGFSEEQIDNHVVWYDVEHLIVRPNRGQDARDAHASGAISDDAFRDALGFTEDDAPPAGPDEAVTMALDLVRQSPSLLASPGLPQVVAQIRAVLDGDIPEVADPSSLVIAEEPVEEPPAEDTGGALPIPSDPAVTASGIRPTMTVREFEEAVRR